LKETAVEVGSYMRINHVFLATSRPLLSLITVVVVVVVIVFYLFHQLIDSSDGWQIQWLW